MTSRRLRILFVATRFPFPPYNGDQVRAYNQLRLLSAHHDIILLAPEPQGTIEERRKSEEALTSLGIQLDLFPPSRWRGFLRLLTRGIASRLPWQTILFCDPLLHSRVRAISGRQQIDILHVQLIRAAPVVREAPAAVATVLDLVDALSANMRSRAERGGGRFAFFFAMLARREAAAIARYERALFDEYDEVVLCAEGDVSAVGARPNLRVVTTGVDMVAHPYVRGDDPRRAPATIVFSGTMWYFPNVDAAEFLVREVLPIVRREVPDARVQLVGARPDPRVRALAEVPGVEVTGTVPNLHDYISRATVAVAPMRGGTGFQLKVAEAMAAGTPVVATRSGLGGYHVVHGRHLLIADDSAADVAANLVRCLTDAALRQRLSEGALGLVEERYTWETTVTALEAVYDSALLAARARAGTPAIPVAT
jgi:glycosyltransferase involved in cell wall biosynthesis